MAAFEVSDLVAVEGAHREGFFLVLGSRREEGSRGVDEGWEVVLVG